MVERRGGAEIGREGWHTHAFKKRESAHARQRERESLCMCVCVCLCMCVCVYSGVEGVAFGA